MRIGVLTGGGDCPGLNAAIRAVAHRGWSRGDELLGIRYGWRGLLGEGEVDPLRPEMVTGILHVGGTVLGTSRTNPARSEREMAEVLASLRRYGIDGLVAIGGDDTLSVALRLHREGVKVVGIPKTIDNDVPGTDACIGFDSGVAVVAEALDHLHTTASSHHRVMVVEIMGREAGWLAVVGGITGGADFIAIPEEPIDIEDIVRHVRMRWEGRRFSIIAVAEGAKISGLPGAERTSGEVDQFGHAILAERGIGNRVADEIERRAGVEARVTVLGHLQRGGPPTAFDRLIATRFGVAAVDYLHEGKEGNITALRGRDIVPVPLEEVGGKNRLVDRSLYELAKVFYTPYSLMLNGLASDGRRRGE